MCTRTAGDLQFHAMRPPPAHLLSRISAYTLLLLLALLFLVHTVVPAASKLSHGFMAYFVAAQTIRQGEPGDRLYDDDWFAARVMHESRGTVTDIYLANPPTLAVAWLPFAYLSVETARRLWIVFSTLCLAASLWLILLEFGSQREPWAWVAISALFTLPVPAREQFGLGQMYACLLLLHVIGWRAYVKQQDVQAGIALGLAMVLKVSGWPICLLMLAQRRWIALRSVIATGLAGALLSLAWVGLATWQKFLFEEIPGTLRRGAATLTAYQDTTGFWQHMFRYVPSLNPTPVFDAPLLATLLTAATTLVACVALTARQRSISRRFVAAVTLSELLSPAAEQYHYIILLFPLAVLWHEAYLSRDRVLGFCALAATLLIGLPIDYKSAHPVWFLIYNYPRLLGGWIVFTALLLADRSTHSARKVIQPASIMPVSRS
jgi:hypothetical protein